MNYVKKAKEYAIQMHKKCEELHGHKCTISDMYYRNSDIKLAFEIGWEEAIIFAKEIINKNRKIPTEYIKLLDEYFEKLIFIIYYLFN